MSVLIGIVALPFLLWSWLRDGNQEDAELAMGLIGCIALAAASAGFIWYAFL